MISHANSCQRDEFADSRLLVVQIGPIFRMHIKNNPTLSRQCRSMTTQS